MELDGRFYFEIFDRFQCVLNGLPSSQMIRTVFVGRKSGKTGDSAEIVGLKLSADKSCEAKRLDWFSCLFCHRCQCNDQLFALLNGSSPLRLPNASMVPLSWEMLPHFTSFNGEFKVLVALALGIGKPNGHVLPVVDAMETLMGSKLLVFLFIFILKLKKLKSFSEIRVCINWKTVHWFWKTVILFHKRWPFHSHYFQSQKHRHLLDEFEKLVDCCAL